VHSAASTVNSYRCPDMNHLTTKPLRVAARDGAPVSPRRWTGLGIFSCDAAALVFSHGILRLHDLGWTRPGPPLSGTSAFDESTSAVPWLQRFNPKIYHALIGCPSGCNTLRGRSARDGARCALCVLSWEETPNDLGSPLEPSSGALTAKHHPSPRTHGVSRRLADWTEALGATLGPQPHRLVQT